MDYWSDDSMSSVESEEEEVEYRDPRDIDYEYLEQLLETRHARRRFLTRIVWELSPFVSVW